MTTPAYTTRTTCRACHSSRLTHLFSLGTQYVSDFVPKEKVKEGVLCPIDLILCRACSLVQLRHTARQDLLYTRHYWYRSGVTQTMRAALQDVVDYAQSLVPLKPADVVLDIGSNDGTLLRCYPDFVTKVGVEPALNMVEEGSKGVNCFVSDFWSAEAYLARMPIKARVITACGMLYDLEDPNQFIADVARCLTPNGVFVAQLMCLRNMLNINDLGNLAHEHLEFYSLASLVTLFKKHGLHLADIHTNNVNGESYRLTVTHADQPRHIEGAHRRIHAAYRAEQGLDNPETYTKLFAQMEANREHVRRLVGEAKAKGKRVWVYGASTKGNVILQYYGLDHTLIDGAADRSPQKWGLYTVGTGIPIVSEADARAALPDYFLVLPYAFLPEFVAREADKEWRMAGGKFIVPLPYCRIV